jgi:nucleotide-binding universal stress UspA family protein
MTDFSVTVAGWDGSRSSSAALDWAAKREARRGGTLVIARAVMSTAPMTTTSDERFAAEQELTEIEASRITRENPGIGVQIRVMHGGPVNVLSGLSERADLVVVGAHHDPFQLSRAGWSVGTRLAADAACAVAIVPMTSLPAQPTSEIVAGVDGTDGSLASAWFAASEARLRGESLRLVHVWAEPSIWAKTFPLGAEMMETIQATHQHTLDDALAQVRSQFPDLDVSGQLERGSIARSLLTLSPSPGLVVVGSRSHSVLTEMLVGTVGFELLANQNVPVVIVRFDGKNVARSRTDLAPAAR